MKVTIDAAGRRVAVECADANISPRKVLSAALATWRLTEGSARPSEGPAFGLAGVDLADCQQSPMNIGIGEVKA